MFSLSGKDVVTVFRLLYSGGISKNIISLNVVINFRINR